MKRMSSFKSRIMLLCFIGLVTFTTAMKQPHKSEWDKQKKPGKSCLKKKADGSLKETNLFDLTAKVKREKKKTSRKRKRQSTKLRAKEGDGIVDAWEQFGNALAEKLLAYESGTEQPKNEESKPSTRKLSQRGQIIHDNKCRTWFNQFLARGYAMMLKENLDIGVVQYPLTIEQNTLDGTSTAFGGPLADLDEKLRKENPQISEKEIANARYERFIHEANEKNLNILRKQVEFNARYTRPGEPKMTPEEIKAKQAAVEADYRKQYMKYTPPPPIPEHVMNDSPSPTSTSTNVEKKTKK